VSVKISNKAKYFVLTRNGTNVDFDLRNAKKAGVMPAL
jgi:hypothetical protein